MRNARPRSLLQQSLPLVVVVLMLGTTAPARAAWAAPPSVPRAVCGPGAHPETGLQGRVTAADIDGGYAGESLRCNAEEVGRFGSKDHLGAAAGGFKVLRHVDRAGRECAYYDSALAPPFTLTKAGSYGHGVYVLDMSDPAQPVKTENLTTPAMLSPHESLNLNLERGLLVAVAGLLLNPGFLDVYDVNDDCRHPVLKSSTPFGIVGHEGNFSPDGNTFWASAGGIAGTPSLTAIDISNPVLPRVIWTSARYGFHGLSISEDGNRMYAADLSMYATDPSGLRILDVSEIQARRPSPQVREVARMSWDTWSVPQMTIPITIADHPYLIEVDEFARGNKNGDPAAPIGGARIIDIADDRAPFVVSDIRLEVHQPENIATVAGDPGATNPEGGYAPHYCSVPQRDDPGIVACSFILSGLRIFDIRDPKAPREIAYFNAPVPRSNVAERAGNAMLPFNAPYAMSGPAFVPDRHEVWYTDASFGFFNVRLTNGVWPARAA